MADATANTDEVAEKSSKLPLILGLVAGLAGAGGGFYATYSGLVLGDEQQMAEKDPKPPVGPLPDVAFVEVDPMIVSMGKVSDGRHLRFRAQLEVPSQYVEDVRSILPRVVDVLNGYLRALDMQDIENTSALTRLRAQMLRRVQIVTGEGRVNDLLIMEFVLT